jgi:hypothetical protein
MQIADAAATGESKRAAQQYPHYTPLSLYVMVADL